MRFTSLRPTQPFISSFLHPSRPFSTSRTHFLATPPRSPKARAAERARNHALPTLKPRLPPSGAPSQAPSQESLPSSNAQPSEWPVQLLAASHASGALPLPPSEAVPLLEKFSGLVASRRATKRAVEKLCQGDYAVYLGIFLVLHQDGLMHLRLLYIPQDTFLSRDCPSDGQR